MTADELMSHADDGHSQLSDPTDVYIDSSGWWKNLNMYSWGCSTLTIPGFRDQITGLPSSHKPDGGGSRQVRAPNWSNSVNVAWKRTFVRANIIGQLSVECRWNVQVKECPCWTNQVRPRSIEDQYLALPSNGRRMDHTQIICDNPRSARKRFQ